MLSKRLKDRIVEEKAEYSVGRVNWDVARQIMYAISVGFFDSHRRIFRQGFWRRGRLSGRVRGLGVRDDVVDIVRGTVARYSSSLGA